MFKKNPLNNRVEHSSLHYLAKQMYVVYSATQLLMDFFNEALYENWLVVEEKREEIKQLTHQARHLQQEVGHTLTKDRFAPVSRAEVISLLQMQTCIANKAQAITGLVVGRQLKIPPALGIEYFPLLNKSITAVQQTYLLIKHLEDLTAPYANEDVIEQLTAMINQLDLLENITDQLQIQARQALLALELELFPVDVLALYKLLEWTGDLADRAHELGGKLITLLAK